MEYCRKLTSSDRPVIADLWSKKKTIFKIELNEEYRDKLLWRLDNFLDEAQSESCLYGAFIDDHLIATWSVYLWGKIPYYTLGDFFIKSENSSPTSYKKIVNLTLNKIFADMESANRFTFFIIALLRPYQERALFRGEIWRIPEDLEAFARYQVCLEDVIPALTKPNSPIYWNLMGDRLWNKDLWIRRGTLKNEYLAPRLLAKLNRSVPKSSQGKLDRDPW